LRNFWGNEKDILTGTKSGWIEKMFSLLVWELVVLQTL